MADRSMGFNITALDRASKTFVKLAEQVERLSRKLDDLDRKVANPKIEPDVDTKGADAKIGKFARDVRRRLIEATRALPDIDLNVNSTLAEREIANIQTRLRYLSGKTIGVDIDANFANAEITRLQQRLLVLGRQSPSVQVRADTAAAAAALAQIERQLNRLDGRTTRVKADTSQASRGFASLSTNIGGVSFGLGRMGLATGIAVAGFLRLQMAGGIAAAGVALIPPVIGTLASALLQIPALVSVATAGIGTLVLAFSGIGTAVKALVDADKKSAQTSEANAKAREAASHRIQSATETLEDAVRSETRTHRAGLEQVRAAEQSLTAAQRSARQAQEDLTRAREEAREQLEDLQLSVRGAALSERQAALDLADARDRLAEAQREGVQGRELERLVLGVEQAALSYDEAKERAQDLNAEQAEWQRTGIEGSRGVQAAIMGVATANEGVAQAQEALTQAHIQASEANADAARQVARAHQELTRAMQDTGDVGSAAVDKVAEAFAELSPVAADFARFIYALKPAFDQLQESAAKGFLPEFKQGIVDLLPLMLILPDAIQRIGEGLGAMWRGFTDVAGSLSGMVRINEILSNTATFFDHMAPTVSNITDSFLTLAAEGTRAFEELAGELQIWSDRWNEMVQRLAEEGVLEGAFHNLNRVVGELLQLFTDLVEIGARWMDQVGDELQDVIQILGDSFKELAPVMGDASEELLQLTADILPDLTAFLKDIIPYLPDMTEGFVALTLAILPLLEPLFQMQAMLGKLHSTVLEPLLPVLNKVIDGIVWLREELGYFALLPPVFWPLVFLYKGLDDVFNITDKLKQAWGHVWPFLQNVAQGAWDSGIGFVVGAVKTGIQGIVDTTQWLWDKTSWVWPAVAGFVFDAWDKTLGWVLGAIKTAVEGVRDAFQWVWDKATNMASKFDEIGKAWESSPLKVMFDGLKWLLVEIRDVAQEVINKINEIKDLKPSLGDIPGVPGGGGRDLTAEERNRYFDENGRVRPEYRASGGPIVGAGTGTSDSVPFWGSNGEWVMTDKAVRGAGGFGGMASLMKMLESGRRFATGGGIGTSTGTGLGVTLTGGAGMPLTPSLLAQLTAAVKELVGAALEPLSDQLQSSTTPAVEALRNSIPVLRDETVLSSQTMRDTWAQNNAAVLAAQQEQSANHFLLRDNLTDAGLGMQASISQLQAMSNASWLNMQQVAGQNVNTITGPIFGGLNAGMANVRTQAQQTAMFWQQQMASLMAAAADPIRWIMQFPLGPPGLAASWNTLDDQFKLGKRITPAPVTFAEGGRVDGPGTGTSDSILARISRGEFVVREKIAKRIPHFLNALNSGQAEAIQAAGGSFANPPGFAAGGLVAAQQFAQAQHGKPYIWGGVGPAGYDCSGFQSAITNVLRGQNPHRRLGNTGSFPWGGFQPGLGGAYAVGAFKGSPGHMAGTLGGNNVEAGGSPSRTKFVAGAVGADHRQFNIRSFLPEVGGVFAPGGAGGGGGMGFDPGPVVEAAFKRTYDMVNDITRFFGTSNFVGGNQSMTRELVDKMKTKAMEAVGAMFAASGLGPLGSGAPFYVGEISRAAKARALGRQAAEIGVATALVESNLRNLANPAVPESLAIPNDGLGHDHDSVGLFQQRNSWGPASLRMNPFGSAGLFFNRFPQNWMSMPPGDVAANIQRPAAQYRNRYATRMPQAAGLVSQFGQFGRGAIFTKPTLGLLGEAGPEVLLPARQPQRAASLARQAGITAPVIGTLNVTTTPNASADQIINSAFHHARVTQRRSQR